MESTIGDSQAGSDGPSLDVFVKDGAASPWKNSSWLTLEQRAPTPLAGDDATPSATDVERAEEVDLLLQTWIRRGEASGLEVTDGLTQYREELNEWSEKKGINRVTHTAAAWGRAYDRTVPGGPVRAVRVEEGLLVLTDQEWASRLHLEERYTWDRSATENKIYGQTDEEGFDTRNHDLTAAILVPESGDAEVLGASVNRVIDFPR